MITIQGKGVSAGVGVGPLYYYRRATAEIKRYTVEDTDAEWHRFKGAQTGAVEQLGQLAEQARAEAGDEAAMLFETHQMMAEDLDYEEAIEDRITNQKMNAEAAVSDTAEQFAEMFASMDDAYMQARAADVKAVGQRVLRVAYAVQQHGIVGERRHARVHAPAEESAGDLGYGGAVAVAAVYHAVGGAAGMRIAQYPVSAHQHPGQRHPGNLSARKHCLHSLPSP